MRNPQHETIQIVAPAAVADRIEALFSPDFTLVQIPLLDDEDDLPTYFLGLTAQDRTSL